MAPRSSPSLSDSPDVTMRTAPPPLFTHVLEAAAAGRAGDRMQISKTNVRSMARTMAGDARKRNSLVMAGLSYSCETARRRPACATFHGGEHLHLLCATETR